MSTHDTNVAHRRDPVPLAKLPTGVAGLDTILHGGVPKSRTTLLVGGPGSGKTLIALEMLVHAASAGQPAVFISFEESAEAVRTNALAMGWDLKALEDAGRLVLLDPRTDYRAIRAGEFSIRGIEAILAGHAGRIGANLIVIDAIDGLMRLFDDGNTRDDELYAFHHWLTERKFTTVMTFKARTSRSAEPAYPFLDFLADCVVLLDQRIQDQVSTRRLRVTKYRGSGYATNECPFLITPGGIVLMPISSVDLVHKPTGPPNPTGNAVLDRMLGGGFRQGATVLIAGPTGSGKTTVGSTFASAACRNGQRVFYVSFEESAESLMQAMASVAIDLASHVDDGSLQVLTTMPESIGVEAHLLRILGALDRFQPDHVIVDAISSTIRMGSESAAFDLLVRLLGSCRDRGITCICLNQTPRSANADHITGIGISSIIDTVVLLDYQVVGTELARSILVLKSRSSRHSLVVHHLSIGERGIEIQPPDGSGEEHTT